jgi:hypothetical protein
MREYLRSYDSTLTIPYTAVAGTTVVEYVLTDLDTQEQFASGNAVSAGSNVWNIVLSKEQAKYDRDAKLSLTIGNGTTEVEENYLISIVRPYATATEIAAALELTITSNPTSGNQIKQSTLERLERYARTYIDTNIDRFYFEKKYVNGYGQDSDAINFTDQVKSIYKIYEDELIMYDTTASPQLNEFELDLVISPSKYQIKMVEPGEEINEWVQTRILVAPVAFKKNKDYKFYGEFGWEFLPNDINYATILLVNEYLCTDFNYKARGIASVSNDSFNVKYSETAMSASGNAYIDSILAPYKKLDFMAV